MRVKIELVSRLTLPTEWSIIGIDNVSFNVDTEKIPKQIYCFDDDEEIKKQSKGTVLNLYKTLPMGGDAAECIKELKSKGFIVVALEIRNYPDCSDYKAETGLCNVFIYSNCPSNSQ